MSETVTEPPVDTWAILELMGHRRRAIGRVTTRQLAGREFIAIDRIDAEEPVTQLYGAEAVYCLTPVTEEQARKAVEALVFRHRLLPPTTAELTEALDTWDDDGFTDDSEDAVIAP